MSAPDRPIHVELHDERSPTLSRGTLVVLVLFRAFLAIPQFILIGLWSIGVLFALPVNWLAVLFTGRLPEGLHVFAAGLIRYTVRTSLYVACVTHVWPAPTHDEGRTPVDVVIPPPEEQSRWSAGFRLVLVLPPLILVAALTGSGAQLGSTDSGAAASGALGIVTLLTISGWCVALLRGRVAPGNRELLVWALEYSANVYAYLALVTGRFPGSGLALEPGEGRAEDHPVRASLTDDGRRSRLVAFFRPELLAPHIAWLLAWGVLLFFTSILAWFVTLLTGRPPAILQRFAAAYVRYSAHVTAFATYAARPFPGFAGALGMYPLEITTPPRARQNRWKTAFRLILALPPLILWTALTGAATLTTIAAWVVGTLLGRTPSGLRDIGAFTARYGAQVLAYLLFVTDRYPDSGTALRPVDLPPDPWLGPAIPADWMRRPEAVLA